MTSKLADLLLEQKLDALAQKVSALETTLEQQYRVVIETDTGQPFLGQPAILTAQVTRVLDGRPAANVAVTFATSWGRLQAVEGYRMQQGSTVTLRTFPDGSARVRLLPPTAEPLLDEQAEALIAMLATLDAEAATPRQIVAEFEQMVRLYRWEANLHFRRATDIFFRDFRNQITQTINRRDYLAQWEYYEATVMAHARPEGDAAGGPVNGSGVLNLAFKDWLAPWLETYLASTELATSLSEEFETTRKGTHGSDLLDVFRGRIRDFVKNQRGLAGTFVGNQLARSVLDEIASSDLDSFDAEVRPGLAAGLKASAAAVAASGADGLAGLGQIRAEARHEMQRELGHIDIGRVAGLSASLGALASGLRDKADTNLIDGFRNQFQAGLTQMGNRLKAGLNRKADSNALVAFQNTVENRFGSVENDFSTRLKNKASLVDLKEVGTRLGGRLDRLNEGLGSKLDRTIFTNFETVVNQGLKETVDVETFSRFQSQTSKSLSSKVEETEFNQFRTLTDNQIKAKLNSATFTQFRTQTNNNLNAKLNSTAFIQFRTQTNNNLNAKLNTTEFTKFETRTNNRFATKLNTVTFSKFKRDTENTLETKVELQAFTTLRKSLSSNLKELSRRVAGFTVIDTQVFTPVVGTPFTPVLVPGGINIGDRVINLRPNRPGG